MRQRLWQLLLMGLLVSAPLAVAQQQWQWISPRPTGNNIGGIAAVGERWAWFVDEAGVVMRSEDGGINWTPLATPVQIGWPTLTFIDSLYGWVVGGVANSGAMGLIIHTSDGGDTWTLQASNISHFIRDVDFVSRTTGWVLTKTTWNGPCLIVGTVNGGADWDTLATVGGNWLAINFVDAYHGWATGVEPDTGSVYQTEDGGISWQRQLTVAHSWVDDVCFIDTLEGWATARTGFIYHTMDGGLTWDSRCLDSTATGISNVTFQDRLYGWVTLGSTPNALLTTTDGGQTWARFQPTEAVDLGQIAGDDGQNLLAAGSGGHIYRSLNGGAGWQNVSYHRDWHGGLGLMAFPDSLHGWLIGVSNQNGTFRDIIWHTADGGVSWTEQTQGVETITRAVDFVDAQTGWIAGNRGALLRTTDAGDHWILLSSPFSDVATLDFWDSLHGVMVAGMHIAMTADGGLSWDTTQVLAEGWLSDVAYSDAQNVWAVSGKTVTVTPDSSFSVGWLLHSSDAGASWARVPLDSMGALEEVTFGNAQTGYVMGALNDHFLRTTDGGLSWQLVPVLVRNGFGKFVAFGSADVWGVLDWTKIRHSTDAGQTWSDEPVLYHYWLRTLVAPDPDHVWALGVEGNAVFCTGGQPLPVTDPGDAVPVPQILALTAFPNPFNPVTTLRLTLKSPGQVDVTLFDITRRQVTRICSGWLAAGDHSLRVDGSRLGSGVYFARLESRGQALTTKLVLLK